MGGWKAVVFDLDDTLYPERDYVLSGFRAVAEWSEARLSIPASEGFVELRALLDRGVRGDTFNQWLSARQKLDKSLIEQLVGVYRDHNPEIRPFPGVPELLSSLKKSSSLGLLSDGYLGVQQRKLQALNLRHFFDAVVFSDEWGRAAWKPNTLPFEKTLEKLGNIGPASAVYIADNPLKDFLGARKAGLATVQVKHPGGLYAGADPPTIDHRPDIVINSLDLIPVALDKLIRGED
jgi:putative hydrolase of the HAD superfamily